MNKALVKIQLEDAVSIQTRRVYPKAPVFEPVITKYDLIRGLERTKHRKGRGLKIIGNLGRRKNDSGEIFRETEHNSRTREDEREKNRTALAN